MGFFRQDYWSRLQFPPAGHFPEPGTKPMSLESLMSPALVGGFFFLPLVPPYLLFDHLSGCPWFLDIFFSILSCAMFAYVWMDGDIYVCVCVCVRNGIVRARASLFPTTQASEARAQFRKWERRSQAQGLTWRATREIPESERGECISVIWIINFLFILLKLCVTMRR